MQSNTVTIAEAVLGSGALSAIIGGIMARHANRSVEQLRNVLERGLYVTKAHYDLELESFKRLWSALSDLRLKVRGFLGPDRFCISTPDGVHDNWIPRAYPEVLRDFFNAHDTVVRAVTETSPFYPAAIRQSAEQTFDIDLAIIRRVSTFDVAPMSEPWLVEMRELSRMIDKQVNEVEGLIRARLESLRIVS